MAKKRARAAPHEHSRSASGVSHPFAVAAESKAPPSVKKHKQSQLSQQQTHDGGPTDDPRAAAIAALGDDDASDRFDGSGDAGGDFDAAVGDTSDADGSASADSDADGGGGDSDGDGGAEAKSDEVESSPIIAAPHGKEHDKDFRVPTADELMNFSQTEQLYKSNLFKLQIEELLAEVRVAYESAKPLEAALFRLKAVLDSMPDSKVTATIGEHVLGVELHQHAHDSKTAEITVSKPSRVDLIGSYLVRTVAKPSCNVDVAVEIPQSMLHEKDFLNHRYFDKRALFLREIAAHLHRTEPAFRNMTVSFFRGDANKPMLVIHPNAHTKGGAHTEAAAAEDAKSKDEKAKKNKGKDGKNQKADSAASDAAFAIPRGFVIRILPCLASEPAPFAMHKLMPDRNCVRSLTNADGSTQPTAYYNQSVLEDALFVTHLKEVHALVTECPAAVDAIVLLKIWARQRHILSDPSSANGFFFSMLLAHMHSAAASHLINRHMSCYQIFKAAIQFIATSHWNVHEKGVVCKWKIPLAVTLAAQSPVPVAATGLAPLDATNLERLRLFHQHFDVVFLDSSATCNLASRMSLAAYLHLRLEAMQSLVCLDGATAIPMLVSAFSNPSDKATTAAAPHSEAASAQQTGAVSEHVEWLAGSTQSHSDVDKFQAVFMTDVDLAVRFDATIHIDAEELIALMHARSGHASGPSAASPTAGFVEYSAPFLSVDRSRSATDQAQRFIYSVLSRGFTDRARLIVVHPAEPTDIPLSFSSPSSSKRDGKAPKKKDKHATTAAHEIAVIAPPKSNPVITVGVLFNPANAFRVIDMGPSADSGALAAEFRAFWGEKSELRRFPDGTILEACVWEKQVTHPPEARYLTVVKLVTQHVLMRHAALASRDQVYFVGDQYDQLLRYTHPPAPLAAAQPHSADEKEQAPPLPDPLASLPALQAAFKNLSAMLRSMADIPLSVLSVQAVHPAFHHCAVFPPVPWSHFTKMDPTDLHHSMEAIDVVLQFEYSSAWPDDVTAVARVKSAFYLRMAANISAKSQSKPGNYHSSKSHNSSNNNSNSSPTRCITAYEFLDVIIDGFAFRIRIFHERELALRKAEAAEAEKQAQLAAQQQQFMRETGITKTSAGTVVASGAESKHETASRVIPELERELLHRPLHSSSVRGFSMRFPLFGPVVRLAYRWVCAHMFSGCISQEAVELLVASVFAVPAPFAPPSSSLAGLLRFLRLLATHNFEKAPIIVDVTGDMSAQTYASIETNFKTGRELRMAPHLFIGTAYDPRSQFCTSASHPSRQLLDRIVAFARSSFDHVVKLVTNSTSALPSALPPADSEAQQAEQLTKAQIVTELSWRTAFKTPLESFDAFIILRPSAQCHSHVTIAPLLSPAHLLAAHGLSLTGQPSTPAPPKFKAPPSVSQSDEPPANVLVGFDAVALYARELQNRFSRFATFFFDGLGGRVIGVMWKPVVHEPPHDFSVAGAAFTAPVKNKKGKVTGVCVNRAELLAAFRHTGKGLVDSVATDVAAVKTKL